MICDLQSENLQASYEFNLEHKLKQLSVLHKNEMVEVQK